MGHSFIIIRIIYQVFPSLKYIILGERWQYAKLPLQWANSGTVTKSMGTTGFVFSGGVLYDHRSGPQDDAPLAVYYEGPTLDPYSGHSDHHKQYHYHAVSNRALQRRRNICGNCVLYL